MMQDSVAEPLRSILDQARWAPSGDNEQCWRFEVVNDDHFVVHGYDTRDWCVYDLDGTSSQIGLGALLETIVIAASMFGRRALVTPATESTDRALRYDVRLVADTATVDSCAGVIEKRSVQRRPLSTRPLTADETRRLEESVGSAHRVIWRGGKPSRRRMAALLFTSARLRLVMPEAYRVHRDAIDWGQRFSEDRVPERAVGMDPATAHIMRWVMKSWPRVRFFNRFLAGTWAPRVQLDVLPALRCAAHFLIVARRSPSSGDDFVAAGRAMQRFWLTATALGLQLQPEMTPLIFARYGRQGVPFSALPEAAAAATGLARRMDREFGNAAPDGVFLGRIGAGQSAKSRSLRKPLQKLLHRSSETATA